MRKMTMLDLTEPRSIWIPWTRSGTAAHALSPHGKTALDPWITFSSAVTFERTLRYVGMTDQQFEQNRRDIKRAGNGCTKISAIPGNRKNLFKIDFGYFDPMFRLNAALDRNAIPWFAARLRKSEPPAS